MNRRLRARHRWMVLILAAATALLFAIAIAGRRGSQSLAGQRSHLPAEPHR